MQDLRNPGFMWLKGVLFLIIGLVSAALVWLEARTLWTACLLSLAIWGFCRAYYFAFYVIGKYVDPSFRFAGLGSFLVYLWRRRGR